MTFCAIRPQPAANKLTCGSLCVEYTDVDVGISGVALETCIQHSVVLLVFHRQDGIAVRMYGT